MLSGGSAGAVEDLDSEVLEHGMSTPSFSLDDSPPPPLLPPLPPSLLGANMTARTMPAIITDDMVVESLTMDTGDGGANRLNHLYNQSTLNDNVRNQMQILVRKFQRRASRIRSEIEDPLSSEDSAGSGDELAERSSPGRLSSQPSSAGVRRAQFAAAPAAAGGDGEEADTSPGPDEAASQTSQKEEEVEVSYGGRLLCCRQLFTALLYTSISPQSVTSLLWLGAVSTVFIYNCCTIPLRASFPFHTVDNAFAWNTCDYLSDFINLLDMIVYRPRVKFYRDGFWVCDVRALYKTYYRSGAFVLDALAVAPLNAYQAQSQALQLLRLNRLLKLPAYWQFVDRLDSVLASPQKVRAARTVFYMVLLVHFNACAYYAVSRYEGIAVNTWTYNGVGNPYISCLYFATKLAISIGKNPKPVTLFEHVFMAFSWLFGVFIFAVFLGQIRDIVGQMQEKDELFRSIMDNTVDFMRQLDLPPALQDRIKLWLRYTWQEQKSLNELKPLEILPQKIQTDIALDIHGATLRKVQMFKGCDEGLLRDIVLQLKPINYLPGDFVCKKGEVGREMYIVQAGQVMVMGGESGRVVLATLQQGSVFGEISLLGLEGLDRRTADVRSRGFSTLFVLDKSDLHEAISSYPDAQRAMQERAREVLKKNAELNRPKKQHEDDVIIDHERRSRSPKLLHTVFQVADNQWTTVQQLRRRTLTSQSHLHLSSAAPLPANALSPLSLPPRWHTTPTHSPQNSASVAKHGQSLFNRSPVSTSSSLPINLSTSDSSGSPPQAKFIRQSSLNVSSSSDSGDCNSLVPPPPPPPSRGQASSDQ